MTLGVALFAIGAGAVHWARTLMSDVEIADQRHPIEAEPEVKAKVLADFKQGAKESALGRRKLIRNTMFGALALFPLSGVMLLRDLGPLPGTKLRHTLWSKGKLLVNMNTNEPLRASDVAVGSLTFAKPEGLEEHDEDFQLQIAKAALMIVRLQPENIKDKRELAWSHEGIVAYSKICTHVGCPISCTSSRRTTCSALPPVHLRPLRRCPSDLRPGRSRPAAAAHRCERTGLPRSARRLRRARRSCLLGARMSTTTTSDSRPSREKAPAGEKVADWADGRLGIYSWPSPTCARSSPTTGRSCWVRSASTASSSSSSRVCT